MTATCEWCRRRIRWNYKYHRYMHNAGGRPMAEKLNCPLGPDGFHEPEMK